MIGLVGSGRTEIARAIIGADEATGSVRLAGVDFTDRSPHRANLRVLVIVREDRRKQGLVMTLPVRPNMTLPHLGRFARMGIMKRLSEDQKAADLIDYFRVRLADPEGDIAAYSGGNQPKVLIGKWLIGDPKAVILDEPSRGVDVGARQRIHEAIAELAARGVAVLIISSETEEVLGLAHRAHLVDRGRIVEMIDPAQSDEDQVLAALFRHQSTPETSIKA